MLVTEEVDGELNRLPGFHFYCGLPYSNGMNFKGMWSGAGKGSRFYVVCRLGETFRKRFPKTHLAFINFAQNYKKLCEAKENY